MKNKTKAMLAACALIAIPLAAFAQQPAEYYCSPTGDGIFKYVDGFASFLTYLITGAVNIC